MPSPRFRLFIALGLVLTLLLWFAWWRRPAVQAPRTFALLQQAIASGSAGGVLDQLHADYDFPARWPTTPWAELGDGNARELTQRALTAMFFMQRDNRLSLVVDLFSVTPGDNGRVTVVATLHLSSHNGTVPFQLGPIHRHRFVLVSTGFTGRLAILDHDPISFSR